MYVLNIRYNYANNNLVTSSRTFIHEIINYCRMTSANIGARESEAKCLTSVYFVRLISGTACKGGGVVYNQQEAILQKKNVTSYYYEK